jgi:hypothetical protein
MNINVLSGISQRGMVNFPANSWMKRSGMKGVLFTIVFIIGFAAAHGQQGNPLSRFRGGGGGGGKDSLQHRKDDTISISFRFL